MTYAFGTAWRNIRSRPLQTFIPSLVIALAIALSLVVAMLADGIKEGIIESSDPFGVIVIGAPGSSQQLVLNTVLLQDEPVGNIDYSVYEALAEDTEQVRLAVPLAFGDNVGGSPVIGTNYNFFELRDSYTAPPAFQLAEGRLFTDLSEHDHEDEADHADEEQEHAEDEDLHAGHDHAANMFEAVLGSRAAKDLGLGIDDHFQTIHGTGPGIASDVHTEVYTVVGILKPSDTPYDAAVLTQIENTWHVHAVHEDDPLAQYIATDLAAGEDQVTAVLVIPTSFTAQNRIAQEFENRYDAQAVFPGAELVELFDLIDQAQEVLVIVGYMVLVIAALTVFLAMYNATMARQQAIAIMRSLGSSRITVFQIILFETLLVVLLGTLLGRLLGYSATYIIATTYEERSFIPIPLRFLPTWELLLWVVPLGIGALAGLLPAWLAYRVNVVEKLFPA